MIFSTEFEIANLINLQQKGQLSSAQQAQLEAWLSEDPANRQLFENLTNEEELQQKFANFSSITEERAWLKVQKGIATAPVERESPRLWPKVLIAAAAVMALVLGFWLFEMQSSRHQSRQEPWVLNDISPGRNGATLVTATGERIALDSSKSGVSINASSFIYSDGSQVTPSAYRTTPGKGLLKAITALGQTYAFTLPDGSRVWLNAGSELSFPSTFKGDQRRVTLTGEGYFEVAKDSKRPFLVESNGQILQVLGTHFNVNSYPDEHGVKTTLTEGAVKLSALNGTESLTLAPGEQGTFADRSLSKKRTDTDEALAWKNGYFRFNDEPIDHVMRKLARWYNFEVVYEGGLPSENLNGRISRSNNISQVLIALQNTGTIHFKVEGRRVTVMQ